MFKMLSTFAVICLLLASPVAAQEDPATAFFGDLRAFFAQLLWWQTSTNTGEVGPMIIPGAAESEGLEPMIVVNGSSAPAECGPMVIVDGADQPGGDVEEVAPMIISNG